MAVVLILAVNAVSRNLVNSAVHNNADCAVLFAYINSLIAAKASLSLVRLCACADIPVVRSVAHNAVAYTSAYDKRIKTAVI